MAEINFNGHNLGGKDYVIHSLNNAFTQDDIQSVLICLHQHRGKHFAKPNQGSYLYKLRRAKDVERNKVLARQYAEQALEHMMPNRFKQIDVSASRTAAGRIDLTIKLTKLGGQSQIIHYFVKIGG